jgi:hypothetical protein
VGVCCFDFVGLVLCADQCAVFEVRMLSVKLGQDVSSDIARDTGTTSSILGHVFHKSIAEGGLCHT